jgi:hypothetical protein
MLILISGFRGSGKDTLGGLIMKDLKHYKRFAFADELKIMVAEKYGFDVNLAHLRDEKDKPREEFNGLSIRDICRKEALVIETANPLAYSEIIINKIFDDTDKNYVITDFRFECHYHHFVKFFGKDKIITVRVNRNSCQIPDLVKEPEEHYLDNFPFDIYVENNGTIREMYENFRSRSAFHAE